MKKEGTTATLKPCNVFRTTASDGAIIDGLWFGPMHAERTIIFIHGLRSSAFNTEIASACADTQTAVLTFNNRGHDIVANIKKYDAVLQEDTSLLGGTACEIFESCIHDIQGMIDFVKSQGIETVYLMGHSTGCQKSVYYMSQKNPDTVVKGIILLAPMSDYADAYAFDTDGRTKKAMTTAESMLREGRGFSFMPAEVVDFPMTAQRFKSLHDPYSDEEEIFSYALKQERIPQTLLKVPVPMFIFLAGQDEYADRPIREIHEWFMKYLSYEDRAQEKGQIGIMPNATHDFSGNEDAIGSLVKAWLDFVMR